VGNPNTGKTTLFNALTGYRQRVGNYPGVTVERKTGFLKTEGSSPRIEILDLPGTYSLAAGSADEGVVLDGLSGRTDGGTEPDAVVCVVDAANLQRNLFLVSQVLELGHPAVVALNMVDLAGAAGLKLDVERLAAFLGVPVVEVVAPKGVGIAALKKAIIESLDSPPPNRRAEFPACIGEELGGLWASVERGCDAAVRTTRMELLQALLNPGGYHEGRLVRRCGERVADELRERRERIRNAGEEVTQIEARVRYAWIDRILPEVVTRRHPPRRTRSNAADRYLTHPVLGLAMFVVLMVLMFQAVFTWASPVMDLIDGAFAGLGGWVGRWLPTGALQSLIANGLFAGVGAVLVFLPQILILFLFIAVLEDCGYMSRAAFLVDRYMRRLGLSGKSFIPLLSCFACAIPGIMATRTIENPRHRLVTILIAPLMSCSARLPIYVLMIGAFVPATPLFGGLIGLQAATLLVMYALGVIVAIPVALILGKTVSKGESFPFLMELPTYKWPSPGTVLHRMYAQGRAFVVQAGTVIFAVTVVVWAMGYYPRPVSIAADHEAQRAQVRQQGDASQEDRLSEIDRAEAGCYLRQSFLGRLGRWIEPLVKPLGWDWRIGTAVIASLPAREVVIASLGTIYNLGGEHDEASADLRSTLHRSRWPDGRPVFNLAVALSIMVFFALCCQCGATLAIIRRETNRWRWPLFAFGYMTVLAYVGALATYQIAIRLI
jgi:ferrous iron transport protein B